MNRTKLQPTESPGLLSGIIFFIAVILFSLIQIKAARADQSALKIGAILPLTGEIAQIGQALQHGVELAVQESGDKNVEVIFEDEGTIDRTKAVSAFQKLSDIDKVDAVLGSIMQMAAAYGPVAQKAKIPVYILWDENEELKKMSEYIFGLGFSTEGAGSRYAEYAYRQLGIRRIAIDAMQDEWSELISEIFEKRFTALGGKVVSRQSISPEDTDHRTFIARAKKEGAEAIYAPLYLHCLTSFVTQARTLQYQGKILVGDTLFDDTMKALGPNANGIYAMQIWLENPEFKTRYEKAFGDASPILMGMAAVAYDATRMLIELKNALEREGKPVTGQTLQAKAIGFEWKGLNGPLRINSERSASREESILLVKDEKFQVVVK